MVRLVRVTFARSGSSPDELYTAYVNPQFVNYIYEFTPGKTWISVGREAMHVDLPIDHLARLLSGVADE